MPNFVFGREADVSGFEGDPNRRLIPRWRFSRDYGESAEFQGDPRRKNTFRPDFSFLDERLSCYYGSPSVATAADAVACGLTYHCHSQVLEAAEYLLENSDQAMPNVVRMAETVIQRGTAETDIERPLPLVMSPDTQSQAIAVIREKRAQLRRYPRNSLAHIDMARGYAILGQARRARTALRRAMILSPDHRIALRLASRFLVHDGDAEHAHDLLHRHPRTRSDPWLMASEIAIAAVAGRESAFMKRGQKMLEQENLSQAHLTELQSAIATQLLADGRNKAARQTFAKSLNEPTDNTVAQALWARRHLKSLSVTDSHVAIHRGFEARAWRAMENLDWFTVRDEVSQWQCDEPFSSRPASLGSYLGITLLGDYAFALHCADIGLRAEPEDSTLLNNKAVALAYSDQIEKAFETFRAISSVGDSRHPIYVHTATAGLLNFRAGFINEGRDHYRRARDLAPAAVKGRVLMHWAGEEIRLQSNDASRLRKMALEHLAKINDPARDQLEKILLNPKMDPTSVRANSDASQLPTLYIPPID